MRQSLAAALATSIALSGCEKTDTISSTELATFAAANPDFSEKMKPEDLKSIEKVLKTSQKYREKLGSGPVDLRPAELVEFFKKDEKYKELSYVYWAFLEADRSVLFSRSNPLTELYEKELGTPILTFHDTLYSFELDPTSKREMFKVEIGNLLRSGSGDSNASWTMLVDTKSGIITSFDDGDRAFDNEGFKLTHDDKGNLVKEEEKFYKSDRVTYFAKTAVSDIQELTRKLEENE